MPPKKTLVASYTVPKNTLPQPTSTPGTPPTENHQSITPAPTSLGLSMLNKVKGLNDKGKGKAPAPNVHQQNDDSSSTERSDDQFRRTQGLCIERNKKQTLIIFQHLSSGLPPRLQIEINYTKQSTNASGHPNSWQRCEVNEREHEMPLACQSCSLVHQDHLPRTLKTKSKDRPTNQVVMAIARKTTDLVIRQSSQRI
jgi:hypothetical protein